jgi:glutathione S-transferase
MSLIVYGLALSSYSAKLRILLVNKGIPFEEREPPGGSYRSEAYRAIVPMGTLPAIDDDGFILSESEVIAEYLEVRHPSPRMLPEAVRERAHARFLSRLHDLYFAPAVRGLFPHVSPARRDPAAVTAQLGEIRRRLSQLESLALPRPYIAGDCLMLPDCGFAVSVPLAMQLLAVFGEKLELSAPLQAWHDTVQAHPAVVAGLAPWQEATDRWLASQLEART